MKKYFASLPSFIAIADQAVALAQYAEHAA
jgi:hypothetical protein